MVSVELVLCAVDLFELKNYVTIALNAARKNLTTNIYD
jgi:hypothetical protein